MPDLSAGPGDWNGAIPGAGGLPVAMSLYGPGRAPGRSPLVMFVHGFKGFKDWGSWNWMADRFRRAGLAMLLVNLSHNGVEGNGQDFTRLDLFEADTWGRRREDLEAVLDWIRRPEGPLADTVDPDRLGLLGHSMGGGLVVLVSAARPRVRALATLAGISTVMRFSPEQVAEMRDRGHATFLNARTGQEMRVGRALLDEVTTDPSRFDLLAAARRCGNRPWLIVQGTEDPAVSVAEAEALAAAGGERATLRLWPGAAHTFGAKHPPDPEPAAPFPELVEELVTFFGRELT